MITGMVTIVGMVVGYYLSWGAKQELIKTLQMRIRELEVDMRGEERKLSNFLHMRVKQLEENNDSGDKT